MSGLVLRLLGPPLVEMDGDAVSLGLRKALALLVYLAVTKSPDRRDSLATLLWPESDQSRARADLRHSLSLLRRKLGAEWIEADRETVLLRAAADVWLDTDAFRRLVRARQDHGHPETELCPRCLDALERAVELYRGDFLAGSRCATALASTNGSSSRPRDCGTSWRARSSGWQNTTGRRGPTKRRSGTRGGGWRWIRCTSRRSGR